MNIIRGGSAPRTPVIFHFLTEMIIVSYTLGISTAEILHSFSKFFFLNCPLKYLDESSVRWVYVRYFERALLYLNRSFINHVLYSNS